MCKKLDYSKAFPTQALLPKNNFITRPGVSNAMNGTAIPCKFGSQTFFKPDNLSNLVEIFAVDKSILEGESSLNKTATEVSMERSVNDFAAFFRGNHA